MIATYDLDWKEKLASSANRLEIQSLFKGDGFVWYRIVDFSGKNDSLVGLAEGLYESPNLNLVLRVFDLCCAPVLAQVVN